MTPRPEPRRAAAKRAPTAPEGPSALVRVASLAALALAVLVAFGGVTGNGWILFDDPEYVLENPLVNRGWSFANALAFLTTPHGENWHPLTSWSHMLDVQLFGLVPGPAHAVNLALHALVAALLVLALARLTGAWWRSVVVGALFALHPLRVESVAWIAERKDVLSGACFALALLAYARWAERPDRARGALVIAATALGLMAKPMLVTLPFVLVLLDAWPLGRLAGAGPSRAGVAAPAKPLVGLLAEKWPLFALAAASAVATFLVQRGTGAMTTHHFPLFERLGTAVLAIARYVTSTLWPAGLGVFYPHARVLPVAMAAFAALAIAGVTWLALARRSWPWLATGWLWFLGMLVPVIGLVQVGGQAWADRYTYLPAIGLVIAIVWSVDAWAARAGARAAAFAGAGALALVLAALSSRQVAFWKDSRTLFEHTVAVTHDNAIALQGLGNALMEAGDFAGAARALESAARIDPGLPELQNTLGSALGMLGRMDQAIAHFRTGLALRDNAEGHHDIGLAYVATNRPAEAVPEFEAALRLNPDGAATHAQLGGALLSLGRAAEARPHLERALALEPRDADARRWLDELSIHERGATGTAPSR